MPDRGLAGDMHLAFLRRSISDHHQVVLVAGRPSKLPANTVNSRFGPSINQGELRFRLLEHEGGILRMQKPLLKRFLVRSHSSAILARFWIVLLQIGKLLSLRDHPKKMV
jgi:hypothetical protein